MSGSTFGNLFRVTNFGEIARPGDRLRDRRLPARAWRCREADIQPELDRRRPGTSRHVTQRNEPDAVEILSGVFEGRTTGTPICLLIRNTDQRSKDYGNIARHLPPRPRRLHLLAQVRPARSARRRPLVGAADRADGRRRRGGAQVAARAVRHALSRLHDAARRDRDPVRGAGSTCRTTRSSRPTPATIAAARGLHGRAAQGRRFAAARASRRRRAACRWAWASRCSTSSTPTSPTR